MPTVRTPTTDTTIQKRVVADSIRFVEWTACPLVKRLGLNGEDRWDFENWPPGGGKKIEWLEDTLPAVADQLDGAVDATQTVFLVDNGYLFHEGHILVIDTEYTIVQSRANNLLTVTRAQGGTTAATHADNAAVTIRGIAKKTGANYAIGATTTVTAPYNYCQILEEAVRVNRDQADAHDYGVPDTQAYHLAKLIGGDKSVGPKGRAGTLLLRLADMAYYGKRQVMSDSVEGMAGGFKQFITTGLTGDTSTPFRRETLEAQLRRIYNTGGMPDLIVTSAFGATKITQWYEGFVRTTLSEERGGAHITSVRTPVFPEMEIMIDWKCAETETYILDSERVGWVTVRPFDVERKPSLGDYDVDSVLGEYSFVVQNEKVHSIITHSSTK